MKSVIICDMEGLITNLNDGASKMFGYAPKNIVGIKRVSLFSPGETFYKTY
jgi:PAS domain S-box-containing protein